MLWTPALKCWSCPGSGKNYLPERGFEGKRGWVDGTQRCEKRLASGESHSGLSVMQGLGQLHGLLRQHCEAVCLAFTLTTADGGISVGFAKILTKPRGFFDSPDVTLVLLADEERKCRCPQQPSGNTFLFCQGEANMGENLKNGKYLFFIDLKLLVQIFVSLEV